MQDRKRLFILILIMAKTALATTLIASWFLYDAAFRQQQERLIEIVQSHARLMESIASHNSQHPQAESTTTTVEDSLQIIKHAHERNQGMGETGEFTIARRNENNIKFLINHRHGDLKNPRPIPFQSELAEPMRRALKGSSGTVVGLDYRGETVLAAFEPVPQLQIGIVAKIDLKEVRAPFLHAGIITLIVGFLIVVAGSLVFLKISNPIMEKLKRNEAELRTERDKLQNYLDVAGVVFLVLGLDGKVVHINKMGCSLLGKSEDNITGKSWIDHFVPDPEKENLREVVKSISSGSLGKFEYLENKIESADGELRDMYWHNTFLRDNEGKVAFLLSSGSDITLQKKAETDRRQAERLAAARERLALMGELAAGVAHEFRNPLHGVLNCIEMLRSRIGNNESSKDLLDLSDEGLRRMDMISERLLRLGRDEMGPKAPVDLQKLVDESMAFLRVRARKAGVELSAAIQPDLPIPIWDAQRISEALLNLLTNAIDACSVGGRVKISVTINKNDPKVMELSVTDSGSGIPEEIRAKVLEPFFTTKPAGKGTGLGLALVRKIMEEHTGELILDCNQDVGTTVKMRLPIGSAEPVKEKTMEIIK